MSELINNRQKKLKELILSLHEGKPLTEAKQEFKQYFGTITTEEITQMEQALIKDGMKVEEIQRLCDVHAAVFDGSISDIHNIVKDYTDTPGHPVRVFKDENDRIEKLIKEEIEPFLSQSGKSAMLMLRVAFDRLKEIDKHYARKEYLFFPHLEKKGITAPPKVMWGVDDEIRRDIKAVIELLNSVSGDENEIKTKASAAINRVRDMISKENNILIPLLKDTLTFMNWISVDAATPEIGWFLEKPNESWKKDTKKQTEGEPTLKATTGDIPFDAGALSVEQLNAMLNSLPLDLTFVDADGFVKYFTMGKERIFARPSTIIGRHVSMCHPPASVHIVEEIVESFRSGRKDNEDFWIRLGETFVYIRYFAVRDKQGKYLGTLEVTQNIKPIVELQGEKRLIEK
jgi:DUF438 domain-containing protein